MPEVDSETNPPHSESSLTANNTSPLLITSGTTHLPPSTWLNHPDQRPFTAPPTPSLRNPLRPHSVPLAQQLHIPQPQPTLPQPDPSNDHRESPTMILNMINQMPIKQSQYTPTIASDKSTTRNDRHLTDYTINTNTDRFGLRLVADDCCSPTIINHLQTTTKSWHPHIYAKPPKAPTPHSIGDILGLQALTNPPADLASSKVSATTTTTRSPLITGADRPVNVTISQILNAKSLANNDQLSAVDSRLICGKYVAGNESDLRFGSATMRSGSMSEECSEDDGMSDQPLNLSVAKSERRTSPVKGAAVASPGGVQQRSTTKISKKGMCICTVF